MLRFDGKHQYYWIGKLMLQCSFDDKPKHSPFTKTTAYSLNQGRKDHGITSSQSLISDQYLNLVVNVKLLKIVRYEEGGQVQPAGTITIRTMLSFY